jgi:hypothetical protein
VWQQAVCPCAGNTHATCMALKGQARPKASDRRGVDAIWGICITSVRKKLASRQHFARSSPQAHDLACGSPSTAGRLGTKCRWRGAVTGTSWIRHGGACV